MLFKDVSEATVRRAMAKAEEQARRESAADFDTLVEYSHGAMLNDVQALLTEKYPASQAGTAQERIAAVTFALFEKYLDEVSTVYAGELSRRLVDENGDTAETETEIYTDVCDQIGLDQTLNEVERLAHGANACGLNFQLDPSSGLPDPQVIVPQDVYAVAPPDPAEYFAPANQHTYCGFDINTRIRQRIGDKEIADVFVFSAKGGQLVYTGKRPGDLQTVLEEKPHGYVDASGNPLNMFTLWHVNKPTHKLLDFEPHSVFTACRELNVLWSVLLDIIRFQGGGTPVKATSDLDRVSSRVPIGVRFPIDTLAGAEESFAYVNSANDYAGLMATLQGFAQLVGTMQGLAPDDLSIQSRQIQSGIAKIMESLPKLRKRKKAVKWFAAQERNLLWPRMAGMLIEQGKLPASALQLKLETNFKGLEIPKSIDERKAEEEHDLKHGLTTPAQILAERIGISEEDAEQRIAENKAKIREQMGSAQASSDTGEPQMPQAQGGFPGQRPRIAVADLIRGGKRKQEKESDPDA